MAQVNLRAADAATFVGVEGTYGTAPTVARLTPVSGTINIVPQQDELEVNDESVFLHDYRQPARGLKSTNSTAELQCNIKRLAALLTTGTLAAPALYRHLVRALLGGMSPAEGGSVGATLDASPGTTTALEVLSAANLAVGQWILVPTANGREPGRIASISGTTVTLNPGLSTAPTASGEIAHCVTTYLNQDNSLSITLQHAKAGSADEQYEMRGCTGDLEITVNRAELASLTARLRAAVWRQGALSLSVAAGADATGNAYASTQDAVFLLQAQATATRVNYDVEECTFRVDTGMAHVPSLSGVVEGTAGVFRVGARQAVEATVTIRMDAAQRTAWDAQTQLQLWLQIPGGSGATRQWLSVGMPRCILVGNPQPVASSDGRVRYTLTLRGQMDTAGASTLARSPFVMAVG
jgi:hypothetical protein